MKILGQKGQLKLTGMALCLGMAMLLLPASAESTTTTTTTSTTTTTLMLRLDPNEVEARQQMTAQAPLQFIFTVPEMTIHGGGIPSPFYYYPTEEGTLNPDWENFQIELPRRGDTGDNENQEDEFGSQGLALFDVAILDPAEDENWEVSVDDCTDANLTKLANPDMAADVDLEDYPDVRRMAVYLDEDCELVGGDTVTLTYTGKVPGRATVWGEGYGQQFPEHSFKPHFRYRDFDNGPLAWNVLDDSDVQQLTIEPLDQAAFVTAIAPLNIKTDEDFTLTIQITDEYGNPCPYSGYVKLTEDYPGLNDCIEFDDEWAKEESELTYDTVGIYKIVAELYGDDDDCDTSPSAGIRSVYNWSSVADNPLCYRLIGDIHVHSGEGGNQIKFLDYLAPGDHIGNYTSAKKALEYLQYVAGYDFGAVANHSISWEGYLFSTDGGVGTDPYWQDGGTCHGTLQEIPTSDFDEWWTNQQTEADEYQDSHSDFTVFPAYEWHSQHKIPLKLDYTWLHRVVLFRDFHFDQASNPDLPLLAGDVKNLPPQCLVRALNKSGYDPDVEGSEVLVIPHMMKNDIFNHEWAWTYSTELGDIASREDMTRYHKVGEVFSARAYDMKCGGGVYCAKGEPTLTVYEGDEDPTSQKWSLRFGWRDKAAVIGLIGASDNHYQTPGLNDTNRAEEDCPGTCEDCDEYQYCHPSGSAFVLADSADIHAEPPDDNERTGIFNALNERRTYATSGIRAFLNFYMSDPYYKVMGETVEDITASTVTFNIKLMAGLKIHRVELWSAKLGGDQAYTEELVATATTPCTINNGFTENCEVYTGSDIVTNPLESPGEEWWIYYVRAFLDWHGCVEAGTARDEAVWSSPIWVEWKKT